MQKDHDRIRDDRLESLLSSLKREPVFPNDFEEKFLSEMHRRRLAQPAKTGIVVSAKEFLRSFFSSSSSTKWVYRVAGAATAIAIVAIVMNDIPNSIGGGVAKNDGTTVDTKTQVVNNSNEAPFNGDADSNQEKKDSNQSSENSSEPTTPSTN